MDENGHFLLVEYETPCATQWYLAPSEASRFKAYIYDI